MTAMGIKLCICECSTFFTHAGRAKFVDSVANVFEEGRSMDESSMIQIPMELFDHLDNPDVNNPELYQIKMIEDAESRANQLKTKLAYLDVRKQEA